MSEQVMVGIMSLAGIVYLAWVQTGLRRSEIGAHQAGTLESSAGAVAQLTDTLMKTVEVLAGRDALIAELRARIEALEANDHLNRQRISELETSLQRLTAERDHLLGQLQGRAA